MQLTNLFHFIAECTVSHSNWKADDGYYVLLSEAKTSDGKKLFTVSTEAMMCTLIASNYAKWQAIAQYKKDNGPKAKLPRKQPKDKLTKLLEENPDYVDPNAKYWDAKFTSSDAGRVDFCTFSDEGLRYYGRLAKEIKEGRKKGEEAIKKFEQEFQDGLKKRDDITTHAPKPKSKKRGRSGKNAGDGEGNSGKRRKIVLDDDDSDES